MRLHVTRLVVFTLVIYFDAGAIPAGGTSCTNIPPGLEQISLGVDITRIDLQPLDAAVPQGFINPVVNFTCMQLRVWRENSETAFQEPDQVFVTSMRVGSLNKNTATYKTSEDIRDGLAETVGVAGTIDLTSAGVGASIPLISSKHSFSASRSYRKLSEVIEREGRYVKDLTLSTSIYQASFVRSLEPSLSFRESLYDLPTNYQDDPQAFEPFISYFGTHYFANAQFGGIIRGVFQINSTFYLSHTEEEISANVSDTLDLFTGRRSESKTDTEFHSATQTNIRHYGGDTNLLSPNHGLRKWKPTVSEHPLIIGGTLKPITDLIPESLNTKKEALETAIKVYIEREFLNELLENLREQQQEDEQEDQERTELESEISVQLSQELPDYGEAEHLAVKVRQFNFKKRLQSVQFCYAYSPGYIKSGGKLWRGYIGKMYENPLHIINPLHHLEAAIDGVKTLVSLVVSDLARTCAPTDKYTKFSTQSWLMSWYIKSPSTDYPIYAGLEICAKYNEQDVCTSYNRAVSERWTDITRVCADDIDRVTDNRIMADPKCNFQLKLKVREGAPNLMHNLILCYEWREHPAWGNCIRSGYPRKVCATAGSWTEPYKYRADNRRDRCELRFGIFTSQAAVDKAFLSEELPEQVRTLKRRYSNYGHVKQYLDGLMSESRVQLTRATPDHVNVAEMEASVTALMQWQHTELVYRFDKMVLGDGHKIVETRGPLNGHTWWNTHSHNMRWWINTRYPSLYNGVRLCGRNTTSEWRCANLNQVGDWPTETVHVRCKKEDTDCWFELKLQVSEDAPAWMHSLKVCYEWRQSPKGGKCVRNGPPREVCAKANTWTDRYYYTQDNRQTGCEIRFGIFNT